MKHEQRENAVLGGYGKEEGMIKRRRELEGKK